MDELNLENTKKLRAEMDRFKPTVSTQFDHLCYVVMHFGRMLLDQHIADLIKEGKRTDANAKRR